MRTRSELRSAEQDWRATKHVAPMRTRAPKPKCTVGGFFRGLWRALFG